LQFESLFNISIDDIVDYISKGISNAPIIGKATIPGLLLADDLAIG
jgi:hypothetical protein